MALPELDDVVLTRQLFACQGVLEFVREMTDDWKSIGGPGDFTEPTVIIATIFARSTRTFEAVVEHLGNHGFGEQGLMLDRSLFEDMVDARWASVNRELAVERLEAHDRWTRYLSNQVLSTFPEYQTEDDLPPVELTDAEIKQYRALFGKHGDGSWTGVRLWDRIREVEQQWKEGPSRRQFQFFHQSIHRLHNEVLHLSSTSIGRLPTAPQPNDEGKVVFRMGASAHMLRAALFSAFWSYSNLLGLIFEVFHPRLANDYMEKHYLPIAKELFPLTTEQKEKVGRNDPCPCGSGIKYKKCHGY